MARPAFWSGVSMFAKQEKIGVMGSADSSIAPERLIAIDDLAVRLGRTIASEGCILITGELNGIPGRVVEANRESGGWSVGISPAQSEQDHYERFDRPKIASSAVVYTGFGYKGRNVVAIRSCDIAIFVSGGLGTLDELANAYDEGKVVGLLTGTGGIADEATEILSKLKLRKTGAVVVENSEPEQLVLECLKVFREIRRE